MESTSPLDQARALTEAIERGVIRRGRGVPMPPRVREGLVAMLMPELVDLADRFGGRCHGWLERWRS